MKKLLLCICLLGFVFVLSGCEASFSIGETNLQKFCKEIDSDVKAYEANNMKFDDLVSKLKSKATTYCVDEDAESYLCKSINGLKTHAEHFQEKRDCNTGFYASNAAAHNACISSNKLADEMNGKVDQVEHAEITTHVDMECQQILEK